MASGPTYSVPEIEKISNNLILNVTTKQVRLSDFCLGFLRVSKGFKSYMFTFFCTILQSVSVGSLWQDSDVVIMFLRRFG